MTTLFKTDKYSNTIKPVEVLSDTKEYMTLSGYFPTFAEARTSLMDYYKQKEDSAKRETHEAHVKWSKLFIQEVPDVERS
jgi:hypothetical protein